MREFIQDKLRVLLEGRKATHTGKKVATARKNWYYTEDEMLENMEEADRIVQNNPEAFTSTDNDMKVNFRMYKSPTSGKYSIEALTSDDDRDTQFGSQISQLFMSMTANKDNYVDDVARYVAKRNRRKDVNTYQPSIADYALIKLLSINQEEIKDFMAQSGGYTSDDPEQQAQIKQYAQNRTEPEQQYKYDKKSSELTRGDKSELNVEKEVTDLTDRINLLLQQRNQAPVKEKGKFNRIIKKLKEKKENLEISIQNKKQYTTQEPSYKSDYVYEPPKYKKN